MRIMNSTNEIAASNAGTNITKNKPVDDHIILGVLHLSTPPPWMEKFECHDLRRKAIMNRIIGSNNLIHPPLNVKLSCRKGPTIKPCYPGKLWQN